MAFIQISSYHNKKQLFPVVNNNELGGKYGIKTNYFFEFGLEDSFYGGLVLDYLLAR